MPVTLRGEPPSGALWWAWVCRCGSRRWLCALDNTPPPSRAGHCIDQLANAVLYPINFNARRKKNPHRSPAIPRVPVPFPAAQCLSPARSMDAPLPSRNSLAGACGPDSGVIPLPRRLVNLRCSEGKRAPEMGERRRRRRSRRGTPLPGRIKALEMPLTIATQVEGHHETPLRSR